ATERRPEEIDPREILRLPLPHAPGGRAARVDHVLERRHQPVHALDEVAMVHDHGAFAGRQPQVWVDRDHAHVPQVGVAADEGAGQLRLDRLRVAAGDVRARRVPGNGEVGPGPCSGLRRYSAYWRSRAVSHKWWSWLPGTK